MRTLALSLLVLLAGCASAPIIPDGILLGSSGKEDPSVLVAQVISINESGILMVDVRSVNGEEYFRRGARIAADENTFFGNRSNSKEIRTIFDIPGTIIEIEGWNDYGTYRAEAISLVEVPPDHPSNRPKGVN